MSYVPGRSRVGPVDLSKLGEIVDHVGLALVDSIRSLGFLLLQDFPHGDSAAIAGATTVQESLESPGALVEVSLPKESDYVYDIDLSALLVGGD